MDTDDEPSPVDLEELLSLPSEDASPEDVPQYEDFKQEYLSIKFAELLAAVPKDDPFMRTKSCKPCLPRVGSKYEITVKILQVATLHLTNFTQVSYSQCRPSQAKGWA